MKNINWRFTALLALALSHVGQASADTLDDYTICGYGFIEYMGSPRIHDADPESIVIRTTLTGEMATSPQHFATYGIATSPNTIALTAGAGATQAAQFDRKLSLLAVAFAADVPVRIMVKDVITATNRCNGPAAYFDVKICNTADECPIDTP